VNPTEPLPLSIRELSFTYRIRKQPALRAINLDLHPGELVLLAGTSGCGKTTLMRCINGLIPRVYSGELEGQVDLFGQPASEMSMADLSQVVGTLLQDPERQILGSHVLNDVAFGLENLALPRQEILSRVDEALDYLGILHLRERETFNISGGEKQKVALAGVLAMKPKVLLLDEPLASLDPASALEALKLFRRLANEGISILLVEHRVEDVLAIQPDTFLLLEEGNMVYYGDQPGLMKAVDYHRFKLPALVTMERARRDSPPSYAPVVHSGEKKTLVSFKDVGFRYAPDLPEVLHDIDFDINQGDVIAVLGHNGAGKSTLVKHTLGLIKPTTGQVLLEGKDTHEISVAQAAKTVGYVFQSPSQMLFAPSVREELEFGPQNLRFAPEVIKTNVAQALETVHLEDEIESPPLALSFGQQKRVSIAAVLAMRSRILMMDEPTAGQDYWNYLSFMDTILQMPGFDAVIFITHDIDLAVIYANRVLLLYGGKILADGPPQEVLADEERLNKSRVLPSSLLRLNLAYFPQTGRFMRAEALAHFKTQEANFLPPVVS
jgi:energy-coupling factor transport system ATP-binding protein